MGTAKQIRESFRQVAELRQQAESDPALVSAILAVKEVQARRFAGSYQDVLQAREHDYGAATRFFLTELYSAKDFSERDAQFSRIAGAIEKLFPAKVGELAQSLASLHALTEAFDHQMGKAWLAQSRSMAAAMAHEAATSFKSMAFDTQTARRYIVAWRSVGRSADRDAQLRIVLGIGHELGRLTQMPGLRGLLRMMRGPAQAAGLKALQGFMETGFDTFASLRAARGGVAGFLELIEAREAPLLTLLFEADVSTCETELWGLFSKGH